MKLARDSGFKCLVANDGKSGLDLACRHLPTAIVLDLGLPDISGMQVLDTLSANEATRAIPVHVISGRNARGEAIDRGAAGYLEKPVDAKTICNVLAGFEPPANGEPSQLLAFQRDPKPGQGIASLVGNGKWVVTTVASTEELVGKLESGNYDGAILDFGEASTEDLALVEALCSDPARGKPSIVVCLDKQPSGEEQRILGRYARSVIIKGDNYHEQLRDEVALFLHRMDVTMPGKQPPRPMKQGPDTALHGLKVLLVDDDLRNTFALSKVLVGAGLETSLADDGKMALGKLDKEAFDLVLMDIMMPVMDGYEAMRRIRAQERFETLPILALTAKAMPEDRARCIEAGASDYLTKPVDVDRLMSMMRVWLYR